MASASLRPASVARARRIQLRSEMYEEGNLRRSRPFPSSNIPRLFSLISLYYSLKPNWHTRSLLQSSSFVNYDSTMKQFAAAFTLLFLAHVALGQDPLMVNSL